MGLISTKLIQLYHGYKEDIHENWVVLEDDSILQFYDCPHTEQGFSKLTELQPILGNNRNNRRRSKSF